MLAVILTSTEPFCCVHVSSRVQNKYEGHLHLLGSLVTTMSAPAVSVKYLEQGRICEVNVHSLICCVTATLVPIVLTELEALR